MTYYADEKFEKNEFLITEIINEHSEIHHNELIREILDKGLMAKKTAEKNIKSLIKKNIVDSYKSANKIIYSVKPILDNFDEELEHQIIPLSMIIDNLIRHISEEYGRLLVENKIHRLSQIFMLIFRAINCCAVLDAIKNPNSKASIKYETELKLKIRKLLQLINRDADSKIVYSFISDSFSPISRPKDMQHR